MAERQLKLGAILSGVGTTQNGWRHPDLPGDASVDIDWFIENAQKAEAAKFDLEPMHTHHRPRASFIPDNVLA